MNQSPFCNLKTLNTGPDLIRPDQIRSNSAYTHVTTVGHPMVSEPNCNIPTRKRNKLITSEVNVLLLTKEFVQYYGEGHYKN